MCAGLNYLQECEEAEDALDNKGLRIVVAAGTKRYVRDFLEVDKSQTFRVYPSTRLTFNKNESWAIFAYYERNGIKNSDKNYYDLGEIAQPSPIVLEDSDPESANYYRYSEWDNSGRRSHSGIIWGKFAPGLDREAIIIPVIMRTDMGDEVLEFTIYVTIEFNTSNTGSWSDALVDTDFYNPEGGSVPGREGLEKRTGYILGIITNLGMILSAIICAILGVKYMLGSLEEKADYKKDMIPYLIGAVMLMGICTIVKILQIVGNDINNI